MKEKETSFQAWTTLLSGSAEQLDPLNQNETAMTSSFHAGNKTTETRYRQSNTGNNHNVQHNKNTEATAADTEAAAEQKVPRWERACCRDLSRNQYVNQTRSRRATDLRRRSPAGITATGACTRRLHMFAWLRVHQANKSFIFKTGTIGLQFRVYFCQQCRTK